MRLDSRGTFPSGMELYLDYYGWHFSKRMCEFACSLLYKKNKDFKHILKDLVDSILQSNGIKVEVDSGYDHVYIYNVVKCCHTLSITEDKKVAFYVKEYLECYKDVAFTRFYADCIAQGIPIIWEDML